MLPSELGHLEALTSLSLSGNAFTGEIPMELGNLGQHVDRDDPHGAGEAHFDVLYVNLIEDLDGTIPSEFGLLTRMITLALSDNNLDGSIPSELELATKLQIITLTANALTSTDIPSEVCNLSALRSLTTDWCSSLAECCV
eukprot:Nitzschia sp. Nitz4//scaffold398_size17708//8529//8977//NITZ4_008804-RA/size17708-snap-gene-0.1-mRNA-1//1//CDS//3329550306//5874//frame0